MANITFLFCMGGGGPTLVCHPWINRRLATMHQERFASIMQNILIN